MKTITQDETTNLSDNAITVLEKRYLQKNSEGRVVETASKMFRRVAKNISEVELTYNKHNEQNRSLWENEFYTIMSDLDFLPNSPTLINAGTGIQQLSAATSALPPLCDSGITSSITTKIYAVYEADQFLLSRIVL